MSPAGLVCSVCEHDLGATVLEIDSVPALANALWPDAESARSAQRGAIDLRLCDGCGLLTNVAFDPELVAYGPAYENSLHFSATFAEYAACLAQRLVDAHGIRNAEVVEVGSGKGEFLALLCELGANRGVGYDPSYDGPSEVAAGQGSVRFVPALYPDGGEASTADLVCCRHVLEHQQEPAELLARVASALDGGKAVAYFEVPDARYMVEQSAVWDVIYEHPQYFSAWSLSALCRATGFAPLEVRSTYGDQFLGLDAAWPHRGSSDDRHPDAPSDWRRAVTRFGERFAATVDAWQTRLVELQRAGASIALWGAGSKGISFLNLVPAAAEIARVVDVNPRKRGLYVPGTAHRISAPEDVAGAELDVVVVLNPLYEAEIRQRLAGLGVEAETVVV